MNERERLLAVLNGKTPDKIPWYADLSYFYSALKEKGELDPKYYGDEGYLLFYKDLGAGIYCNPPFIWEKEFGGEVSYKRSEQNGLRTETYNTPLGEIKSVEKYLPETYSYAYVKHFVETIEDLRIMKYIFQNTSYKKNYESYAAVDALWGEWGLPLVFPSIPAAPIQKLLSRWAGVSNTYQIYMDHMDEFDEIFRDIEDSEDGLFDIIAGYDAPYVEFAENLSSEVIGKNNFIKYNMPYYKKRIGKLHDSGKYVGIHIDGTLNPCLGLLHSCGFDVAEAVTPYPGGDIKLEDLRESAGDQIIIWGGIPGILFSSLYSDDYFRKYVESVLEVFVPGAKYVLGVADQVPPDGLISRVRLVRELIERKYG